MLLQGATLAEVHHNVAVVLRVDHLVQLDDVGMVQILEDVDLVLQKHVIALAHEC